MLRNGDINENTEFGDKSCLVAILTYLINDMTSSHKLVLSDHFMKIIECGFGLNEAINYCEDFDIVSGPFLELSALIITLLICRFWTIVKKAKERTSSSISTPIFLEIRLLSSALGMEISVECPRTL